MAAKSQTVIILFTFTYLLLVLTTDFSFVGYWTDIIFSVVLAVLCFCFLFKLKTKIVWLKRILTVIAVASSVTVFGLLVLNLINPFSWDTFKMRSFNYINIDGRIFQAYFKPVGSYSGGEGVFWIAETPKYFPLIEQRKYYEGAILWDFRLNEWEGQPINQIEVAKSYIRSEIINKKKN